MPDGFLDELVKVWAVVYSNYEPAEVDSLWTYETEADDRCDKLNADSLTGMWRVVPWAVQRAEENS